MLVDRLGLPKCVQAFLAQHAERWDDRSSRGKPMVLASAGERSLSALDTSVVGSVARSAQHPIRKPDCSVARASTRPRRMAAGRAPAGPTRRCRSRAARTGRAPGCPNRQHGRGRSTGCRTSDPGARRRGPATLLVNTMWRCRRCQVPGRTRWRLRSQRCSSGWTPTTWRSKANLLAPDVGGRASVGHVLKLTSRRIGGPSRLGHPRVAMVVNVDHRRSGSSRWRAGAQSSSLPR
jgi:hypothetical protein